MKKLLTLFLFLTTLLVSGQNGRQKIAHLENGVYVFNADTTAIKNEWAKRTETTGVHYQKIEILRRKTFEEKQEDFYMLIAYDKTKDLKTCRYLIRINDNFYFRSYAKDVSSNDIFFNTVFTCKGKDEVCFPEVLFMNNEYSWGGRQRMECSNDDTCTGIRSVLLTP